jgi:hypothetical protein
MAQTVTELLVSISSKFDPRGMRSASQAIAEQQKQIKTLQQEKIKATQADRIASLQEQVGAAQKQVILRGSASDIRQSIGLQRDLKIATAEQALASQSGNAANLAGVTALTSAVSIGLVGALAAAGVAAAGFGGQFQKAIAFEKQTILDVSSYVRAVGATRGEARAAVGAIQAAIAQQSSQLGLDGRSVQLAGSQIIDDLGFAGLKGAELQKSLIGIASRTALNADITGQGIGNANLVNTRILGGASLNELRTINAFNDSPGFKIAVQAGLAERGVDNTKDLSPIDRVKLLQDAYSKAFSAEDLAEQAKTASAQISGFVSRLFNEKDGILSFSRTLKDGRSVFDGAKRTLELLIGKEGVFGQLSRLLGGSDDPLANVQRAIDGFNKYIEGILSGFSKLKILGGAEIGTLAGKLTADLTDGIVMGVGLAVASVDWGQVGIGVFSGIGSFLANLDWSTYAAGSVALIGATLIPAIGTFLAGAAAAIAAFFGGIPLLIIGAIVLGVAAVVKVIADNWKSITGFVSGIFNKTKAGAVLFGQFLSDGWNALVSLSSDAFDKAKGGAASFGQLLNNGWSALVSLVVNTGQAIVNNVTGFFNAVTTWVQNLWNSLPAPVRSAIGTVATSTPVGAAVALGGVIANRAEGQVPSGFLAAIDRERLAAPIGSRPVIANDSELIIPRGRAGSLIGGGTQNRNTISISAPINIYGGNDSADTIANKVEQVLMGRIKTELEAIA